MDSKKILFVANITKHILRFHLPYLKWFQSNGYETHVASNGSETIPYCNVHHNVPISRSPFSYKNIYAYKMLKKIVDKNNFGLIHGHTPMGGFLARTTSIKSRKKGTKVIYTAHGFHFFKGSSLFSWLFYFPVEKYLSKHTDCLITINSEDYNAINKFNFECKDNYLIPGVGFDTSRLQILDNFYKNELRIKLGFNSDDFILIYIAEFIARKNHKFLINAAKILSREISNLKILFAGRGKLESKLKNYALENSVNESVLFLGFRNDIGNLIHASDIGISTSKQEGLPLNLAEEMYCGLPIIASQDRGHRELVKHGINGFLFEQNSIDDFNKYVMKLYKNKSLISSFGDQSKIISEKFTLKNAVSEMSKIYQKYI